MSIYNGKLCSAIMRQYFGEGIQLVADCLYDAISRTVSAIVLKTKLSKQEVKRALAVLLKYRLITFTASEQNKFVAEYSILRERILYLFRLPKYVHHIMKKYGSIGASIIEEVINVGSESASTILINCFTEANSDKQLSSYKEMFINIVKDNFLIRLPTNKNDESIPQLQIEEYEAYLPPEIDLSDIQKVLLGADVELKDRNIFWGLNYERFHQDFRDDIMKASIENKLGVSASECFSFILKQMYERTDPWQKNYSNPFTYLEVKQAVEKTSNNLNLIKYLDQYLSVIADDSLGFIRKIGDMGGGQFVVDMEKAFSELAISAIESIITEKFGSKASRIFRVIRTKKFIEQEEIQKEAMIPAKEAKLLSYTLFQEQFIQIKTIRKAGGGGMGPAKSFYLFHIKIKQIVNMLLDICYKAAYNAITRIDHENSQNRRLIEKSRKLESIVETMKERGETDEYIEEILETVTPPEREILNKIKEKINALSVSELALDDTMFLLQMYLYHSSVHIGKK